MKCSMHETCLIVYFFLLSFLVYVASSTYLNIFKFLLYNIMRFMLLYRYYFVERTVLLFCLLNTLNEKRFITLCIVVISRAFLL